MEQLIERLKDILEVEELDITKKFSDYEMWDSLSVLSVIALLDSNYHKQMTGKEINSFASIEDFCQAAIK